MKVLKMKTLAFAFLPLLCVSSVMADTVGWWHFDDGVPGAAATADTRAANAVSADYGTGAYHSITGSGNGSLGTDAAHMPKFSQANYSVCDPITGTYHDNTASVRFTRTGETADAVEGGAVVIPGSSELKPGSLTIEGFVRTGDKPLNTLLPIFGRPLRGEFAGESFALCMTSSGKLFARLRTGSKSYASDTWGSGSHAINDNVWHHVALTYDRVTGAVKVYVDYALDFEDTVQYAGSVKYDDGDSLWIGGYAYKGRKLDGQIDEVRLSDVALDPEDFLRFEAPSAPAVVDGDTLFFASFEGLVGNMDNARNFNLASASRRLILSASGSGMDPAALTFSVPGPSLCGGTNALRCVENRQSLHLPKSANSCGYSLQCPNSAYTKKSLTVECFIKCDKPIREDFSESQKIFQFGNNELALIRSSDGQFYALYHQAGLWATGVNNDGFIADGAWHHVAVVYDKEKHTVTFCVDYIYSATAENVTTVDEAAHNLFIGSNNGTSQHFHGAIDGIRITQRALTREEFLNRGGIIPELSATVATMSFENDYFAGPVPYLSTMPEGSGYGYTDGAAPTFTTDVPASLISRDGRAMTVTVTNTAALRVEKGYARFPKAEAIRDENFTAECFCRFRRAKAYTGIMTLKDGESLSMAADWALGFSENTDPDSETYDSLRLTLTDTNGTYHKQIFSLPKNLKGDTWHHLAVTGAKQDDGSVLFTLYCDYVQVGAPYRFQGQFRRNNMNPWFLVGGYWRPGYNDQDDAISADFDEVRISNRALAPTEFLRKWKEKKGLTIIVR